MCMYVIYMYTYACMQCMYIYVIYVCMCGLFNDRLYLDYAEIYCKMSHSTNLKFEVWNQ
jgi:hypothetical protein